MDKQLFLKNIHEHNGIIIKIVNMYADDTIGLLPIITSQNPLGWDYETLEMVSAQSVTGTGLLSELSSSWADFTGGQSNSLAEKIKKGEEICKNALRFNCAKLGGNAIIATDIDYSEVGGGKGMLMVCMAGTAIKFTSYPKILNEKKDIFDELASKSIRLEKLNAIIVPSLTEFKM